MSKMATTVYKPTQIKPQAAVDWQWSVVHQLRNPCTENELDNSVFLMFVSLMQIKI